MSQFEVSEFVAKGHPDKIADQISDAILDKCLEEDPLSKVAVETLISHNLVAVGGEISTTAMLDIEEITHSTLKNCGYKDLLPQLNLVTSVHSQSVDIASSVGVKGSLTAGDQGVMFGFACTETQNYMPLSYEIARSLVLKIQEASFPCLGPDGKTQVCLKRPKKEEASIVLSWQHAPAISIEEIRETLFLPVQEVCDQFQISISSLLLNPSERFVCGGPWADTGVTGRKQLVDSYGSSVRHGGGAYSGKDATKVDRSGAYMARYVAKHVVAAKMASKCEIQLIFSIGRKTPLHIGINCFETENINIDTIQKAIMKTFDFSVDGIIQELQLSTPIFSKTAFGGHFGRNEFSWERLPKVEELQHAAVIHPENGIQHHGQSL